MIIKKGFTIVETLVAITILMIAIAGPLVVASKGLFGANVSKDQMIASYLAQESIEVVKNLRDNNISNGVAGGWLNGIDNCKPTGNICDASAIDSPMILNCGNSLCPIYAEAPGYGHNSVGATPTRFSRGFYFNNPLNLLNAVPCTSDSECGITVEVDWMEGTTPYSVILHSEMTSNLR